MSENNPPPLSGQHPKWPLQSAPPQPSDAAPATQSQWPAQPPAPLVPTRTDQRVHRLAWAVFWLMMSGVCGALAVLTAVTIVGAIVFGLAGFVLWVVALIFSIMALGRT